jgi:pyrroline-5-carboxylate reductase
MDNGLAEAATIEFGTAQSSKARRRAEGTSHMIAFIGAGALAEALIRGALAARALGTDDFAVTARRPERAAQLSARGWRVAGNQDAAAAAQLIVLGVRHLDMPPLLAELREALRGKLLVSLALGVPAALVEAAVPGARVVRAIPNTPTSIGLGVTALAAGATALQSDIEQVEALFATVGEVVAIPEAAVDAVNALSGVGPAYLYALARGLAAAGSSAGLADGLARRAVAHTLRGAAELLVREPGTTESLISQVAGPSGSTRAALDVLEAGGFDTLLGAAVHASVTRATKRNAETLELFARLRAPAGIRPSS